MPHLGNIIGSLLSGDVFTRYYKLRGHEALHVSGTDAHGTQIEFEALKQKRPPHELYAEVHRQILDLLDRFEIHFDNYTSTESPTHKRFVQEIYRKMETNGYIFAQEEERAFCEVDQKFLADSFIVGTCPHCGYASAYGNQCDACGALLEPEQLRDPRCRICDQSRIVFKKTRNWQLDLKKLEPQLKAYVEGRRWAGNVKHLTEGLLQGGLRPRAVTRDLEWGIPAPFAGAEGKVMYVWAENALGYVSATIELFEQRGEPERWRAFWFGDDVFHVYAQGKDNIPFHTIFFPAQLLASGEGYHLPDQIAATEYLNWIGGDKFSKSRNVGLFGDEALELLPAVYWRFYLLYFRPERKDLSFSWEDLDKAANAVLVHNIANLFHRVVSLAHNRYEGRFPEANVYPEIYKEIREAQEEVAAAVEQGLLAPALRRVADLAVAGNAYVQRNRPWEGHKPEVMATALQLLQALAVLLEPFVPSLARKGLELLGLERPNWEDVLKIQAGRPLGAPEPLLEKIDVKAIQEKYQRMKAGAPAP